MTTSFIDEALKAVERAFFLQTTPSNQVTKAKKEA
jgi:hypothetical protein